MIEQKTNNKGYIGAIIMFIIAVVVILAYMIIMFSMLGVDSNKYNKNSIDYNVYTTDSDININIKSINDESIKYVKVTDTDDNIIGIAQSPNERITGERLDGSYNIFVITDNNKEYYVDSIVL